MPHTSPGWGGGEWGFQLTGALFEPSDLMNSQSSDFKRKQTAQKLPRKVIFKGVRQLNINTPPRMQISVHKKGWMKEEGMFYLQACSRLTQFFSFSRLSKSLERAIYLHTVCSEKKLFMRATNTILGIRNKVRTIVLLSRVSRLFAFLLKSFIVLKVSKSTILFNRQLVPSSCVV